MKIIHVLDYRLYYECRRYCYAITIKDTHTWAAVDDFRTGFPTQLGRPVGFFSLYIFISFTKVVAVHFWTRHRIPQQFKHLVEHRTFKKKMFYAAPFVFKLDLGGIELTSTRVFFLN